MNASTQSEISALAESSSLALVTLDPVRYVAEVYAPFRVKLAAAQIVSDAITVDCSTPAGNAIAIEQRAIFRDGVRLAVGKARTERKAPILMIGKLIDSEAARIVEEAAPYEAKYDDAIKARVAQVEAERAQKIAAELARVGAIRADIQMIRDLVPKVAGKPSQAIASAIEFLRTIKMTEGRFEEFAAVAIQAVAATGDMLGKKYDDMLASETAEQARIADAARAAAEHAAAVAQLAADRAELAEQKRLAQIEADRIAAATKAKLDAQQAQIAKDRREQEAIAQAARDVQAAEISKFQAEQAAHAAREAQFQHEKDAHAAELKLAADARAMQIKRDADHIEALDIDVDFNECRFCDDYDEAVEMNAEINESRLMDAHHIAMRGSCVSARDLSADDARGLAEDEDLQFDIDVVARMVREPLHVDIEPDVCDGPTDEEIIEFCEEHEMNSAQAIDRFQRFIDENRHRAEVLKFLK